MGNLRRWIKRWLPEFAIRAIRRGINRTPPAEPKGAQSPEWEYLPQGWRPQDPRLNGWNVPSIAETQKQKWPAFVAAMKGSGPLGVSHEAPADAGRENQWAHNLIVSYAYVLALAARRKDCLSLLDWGGGIGHYYLISKAVLAEVEIDYYCQDVPVLCQAGRSLLPQAHFFDQPGECFGRSYDLVLAGSSLWYEGDWKTTAVKLAKATKDYLYVTRMMFVQKAESFVVVQRPWAYGYMTEYQCWVLNQRDFVRHVEGQGMILVREFIFGVGPDIEKAPERGVFKGFLFKRN